MLASLTHARYQLAVVHASNLTEAERNRCWDLLEQNMKDMCVFRLAAPSFLFVTEMTQVYELVLGMAPRGQTRRVVPSGRALHSGATTA